MNHCSSIHQCLSLAAVWSSRRNLITLTHAATHLNGALPLGESQERIKQAPYLSPIPNIPHAGTQAKPYGHCLYGREPSRSSLRNRVSLSPRVRGNHHERCCGNGPRGSIPACAGEPSRLPSDPACTRVYPRVCGGTIVRLRLRPSGWGLSPRVRGNPTRLIRVGHVRGSIPACAGEPVGIRGAAQQCAVYPRVCGGTILGS